jgi:toxin ParE1/3/4
MASRVRTVVWSESAQRALDEVIDYIANDSRSTAGQVLEAALDVAASLATLPERGRVVPELTDPTVREVFVFRYRFMYQVEEARVVVVAFVHGARDFAAWRSDQAIE